jgi:hypothetical protein
MTPEMRRLLEKWRSEAATWQHGIGDNQNTRTLNECADELEAALLALPAPEPTCLSCLQRICTCGRLPADLPPGEAPPCRVCGGYGFVAQKRFIDDGYGEVESCPACGDAPAAPVAPPEEQE